MGKQFTARELSVYWNVPIRSVYRILREYQIPVVRLGKLIRCDQKDIADFIQRQKVSLRTSLTKLETK